MSSGRNSVISGGANPPLKRGKCRGCGEIGNREWITVRFYRKRFQREYRYHVCGECRCILEAFLEGNAESRTESMFNPPTSLSSRRSEHAQVEQLYGEVGEHVEP